MRILMVWIFLFLALHPRVTRKAIWLTKDRPSIQIQLQKRNKMYYKPSLPIDLRIEILIFEKIASVLHVDIW